MKSYFFHTKHYFRAGLLIVGGAFLFFLGRAFLVPHSFGQYGFYRADNVKKQMDKPAHYAALNACSDCHSEIRQTHEKGVHVRVPCQDCHGPLSDHVDTQKGEMVGTMRIQKTSKLCLRCHLKLPSRPAGFPQIDVEDHLASVPEAHKLEICLDCHNPHDPKVIGKQHERRNRKK